MASITPVAMNTTNQEMPVSDHKKHARDAHNRFLEQIEVHMGHAGVNQSELARRVGISRAYVSEVFTGGRRLSVNSMFRWAAAVGIDVEIRVTKKARPRPDVSGFYPGSGGAS